MYSINGVDLSSTDYEKLRDLVEMKDNGKDYISFANEELHSIKDWNDPCYCSYESLIKNELAIGFISLGGIRFDDLTPKGNDFIHDYQVIQDKEKKMDIADKRHDYKVAAFSAGLGFVLGYLTHILQTILL